MNFGEKLRLLRTEKKLSQKDVADKLHISLRTYASYELNQRRPRTRARLKEIADFFGQSVDYLQIDDIENKIEVLERDTAFLKLKFFKFRKMVLDKIALFLNNLDWEIGFNNIHDFDFDLVATCNSTCIFFNVTIDPELRRYLTLKYGQLCMIPVEEYEETYYVIISNDKLTEEIVNKYQPINLTNIRVKGFSFNKGSNDFYSNEIYKFISKLSL